MFARLRHKQAPAALLYERHTDECHVVKVQTCGEVGVKLFTPEEMAENHSEIREVPD
jgi:hypothetical protein